MQINASVGEASWLWILHHVAITNTTASAVSNLGRTDAVRASGQLAIERQRNDLAGEPVLPLARDLEAQRVATTAAQEEVKAFLRSQRLVTIPEWLPNYTVTGIPAWLAPFDYSQLGEEDDFTSPNRSLDGADFVRYVPTPAPNLPFFLDAMARDPRPVIVHEGIPGHWLQFSRSWRNPREARRRWLDSTANEGLAFYMEEVAFDGGLFDSPDTRRSREIMLRFRQLRGLRAELDAGLATGTLTPTSAATLLVQQLGLSPDEAAGEVANALLTPVQPSSYAVGKDQILQFLSLARFKNSSLSLLDFHDALEVNGNLPITLQAHSMGVAPMGTGFVNMHSAYPGVPVARLAAVAAAPDRVTRLPGVPPVSSGDSPNPVMFSGYVDVNADRSLYYMLVHSTRVPPVGERDDTVPLIVWLQGGNGCSSLVGAFSENGPFYSTDGHNLSPNPHGWHSVGHMLFIDRPAGAGYSFSRSGNFSSFANDWQTARDTVAVLRGVLEKHPWLCGRKIVVAGESYAGHFVVQLATLLAEATPSSGLPPNGARHGGLDMDGGFHSNGQSHAGSAQAQPLCTPLGGVLAGNAVVDINQTNFAWFENGATHSLVADSAWATLRETCDFGADLGIDGNGCPSSQPAACTEALALWFNQSGAATNLLSLYDYYVNPACTDVGMVTDDAPGTIDSPCVDARTAVYLNLPVVRRALHVSPFAPPTWSGCSDALNDAYNCSDTLVSMVPLYTALRARGVPILVYSGDVDGIVPTKASQRWVATTGDASSWRSWVVDGVLGGYTYTVTGADGRNMTVATVRGAGHMVPRFKGAAALALASRFIDGLPL